MKNYTIHAIIFEQKTPRNDSGLYQVFERINTSGMTLNAQEVRNCVYQGTMNSLLFSLNEHPSWRKLYGDEKTDKRMKDIELILRFFAMNSSEVFTTDAYYISLTQLMNKYMGKYQNASSDFIKGKADEFTRTIDFIFDNFGEEAFFNLQNDLTKLRRRLYPTILDSLMIATYTAIARNVTMPDAQTLQERRMQLLKDEEYRSSITQGTMQVSNIWKRISKALQIIYGEEL